MAGLLRHAWRYSLGGTLTTLASVISFPLLTRLLSVDEYGLMNTVGLALTLLVAIGKLGLQKAAVRFYHEAKARLPEDPGALSRLASTLIFGVLGLGALITLAWMALVAEAPVSWLGDPRLRALLLLSAVLVVIRVVDSAFGNLMYAEERSGELASITVGKRYLSLILVIGTLWLLGGGASHFFVATIAAEGIGVAVMGAVALRTLSASPQRFSRPLFGKMVMFGLPMVGVEIAWGLLSLGDRYVIQRLLGAEAVGVYSASYNMCDYVKQATMAAIAMAAVPMYMRIWEQEGRAQTERFLGGYARWHFAASLLIGALVTACAEPLITILASAKYVAGTVVVPWIMLGLAFESYLTIATAGLMLTKRTSLMFWFAAAAAVLNLALNFVLIPWLGLVGSALATLLAFGALLVCALVSGRAMLHVPVPLRTLVLGMLGFAGTAAIAMRIESGHPLADLLVRGTIVALLYVPWMWFTDPPLRAALRERVAPLIRSIGPRLRGR